MRSRETKSVQGFATAKLLKDKNGLIPFPISNKRAAQMANRLLRVMGSTARV